MNPVHPTKKTPHFSNPTLPTGNKLQLQTPLPPGWDIDRIQRILKDYDPQQRLAIRNHNLLAYKNNEQNMIAVPEALIPAVLEMIEKYKAA